ncbi:MULTISPECIES: cytochrome c biogenesis protein CcdC [Bacillaceae]|uniref:CcdC family protein n=1 Tax=Bacillaceae TaxID=186817 RepID=UPI001E588ACE|nr:MULTISPECIES: cytochrome c biogenesis protein CcdC [Bacillaceae]MCE4047940.1 cytochrome c biogenesis protein CcdC [Bacillus sp. Au-Bac7]MCM3032472.1 cytochrome c biogenesis protein CcdC [Niallia sp. MER 6]MDL0436378.1 cytochrome c biogenesis protein CcdC [Niallia sp. SS-2023]UPO89224.1 cytochrome c biogenesis protein CcdC [Niallia sp. Man26]
MTSVILSSIVAIFMGTFFMVVRMKAAKKPVSAKKIILPPVMMSTGALMFVFPMFAVTTTEILESCIIGMLFSILLIKTSSFEIKENDIYLKKSKAFIFILFGLLAVRIVAKLILSSSIDVGALSGMFWILAFSMIVPWRIAMLVNYKKLEAQLKAS